MKPLVKTETNEWTTSERNWTLFSDGIVEPLSFCIELDSTWIELDTDPLTGMVSQEQFSF